MEQTATITNFVTLDGTATSQTFSLPLPPHNIAAKLQFGDVTGLQGTVSVSADGTTFFNVPSVSGGGTRYAAGKQITLSDAGDLYFVSSGWKYVRFSRSAGSGPVRLVSLPDTSEYEAALGAAGAPFEQLLSLNVIAPGDSVAVEEVAPLGARWLELEHLSGTGVLWVNINDDPSSSERVWPAMTVGMAFVGSDRIPVIPGDSVRFLTSSGTSSLRFAFWGQG